jgi:hypothetical protein
VFTLLLIDGQTATLEDRFPGQAGLGAVIPARLLRKRLA